MHVEHLLFIFNARAWVFIFALKNHTWNTTILWVHDYQPIDLILLAIQGLESDHLQHEAPLSIQMQCIFSHNLQTKSKANLGFLPVSEKE